MYIGCISALLRHTLYHIALVCGKLRPLQGVFTTESQLLDTNLAYNANTGEYPPTVKAPGLEIARVGDIDTEFRLLRITIDCMSSILLIELENLAIGVAKRVRWFMARRLQNPSPV